jgi:hypothetical protein
MVSSTIHMARTILSHLDVADVAAFDFEIIRHVKSVLPLALWQAKRHPLPFCIKLLSYIILFGRLFNSWRTFDGTETPTSCSLKHTRLSLLVQASNASLTPLTVFAWFASRQMLVARAAEAHFHVGLAICTHKPFVYIALHVAGTLLSSLTIRAISGRE